MGNLIDKKIKFDGIRFKVIQKTYIKENGKKYIRDCVEPGDAVVILPITENNEVIFIKQQREVIEKIELELPAGMIDKGELPIQTAKRELEEEVGIKSNYLEYLTEYYTSCGYTSEKIYVFLAKDFSLGKQQFDETEEILEIEKIHIDKCMEKLYKNEFEHANVKIPLYTYYYKYCNGGKNE